MIVNEKRAYRRKYKVLAQRKKQRNSEKGKLRQWFHDSVWTHFECTEATSIFIWYLSFTLNLSISRSFPLSIPLGFILCLFLFALMPGKVFAFFFGDELIEKKGLTEWPIRKMLDITMIYCVRSFSSIYIMFLLATKREREYMYVLHSVWMCVRQRWVRQIRNKCRRCTFHDAQSL